MTSGARITFSRSTSSRLRARHRSRCRIFLDKTLREIVNAVLRCDPDLTLEDGATIDPDDAGDSRAYVPAHEKLCWRIQDPSRIDDVRVRPYCVQYNESDLAFVSRLLEDVGISYHFENGAGVCLLVFSDSDQGKARLEPFEPLGPHQLPFPMLLLTPASNSCRLQSAARARESAHGRLGCNLQPERSQPDGRGTLPAQRGPRTRP